MYMVLKEIQKFRGERKNEMASFISFHYSSSLSFTFFVLLMICNLSRRASTTLAFNVPTSSFDQACTPLFGDANLVRSPDGNSVRLLLDRHTGAGFISSNMYDYGMFSASIKLPSNHTAGVVVAFYTSNAEVYRKSHDELDFEFLGNIEGMEWQVQTNVYGNGSVSRGREERYFLWFDPSKEFHRYSILWTKKNIIFYIDEFPIREVARSKAMSGDYPSKPMSLYATIWDGSPWATAGGRYKVDYKFSPFATEFKDLALHGCSVDPIQMTASPSCDATNASGISSVADYAEVTPARRNAMSQFRQKYMTYSYCYDSLRYPTPLPECLVVPAEKRRFKNSGHLKFGSHHRLRHRSRAHGSFVSGNPRRSANLK